MRIVSFLSNIICLIILVMGCIYFHEYAQPFERGMFCNDETIAYPYQSETIPDSFIAVTVVLGPLFLLIILEAYDVCTTPNYHIIRTLKPRVIMVFNVFFIYFLGSSITWLILEVTKVQTGRLRPFFMDVCKPLISNFCQPGSINYIVNITCQETDVELLRNARLSFPSGHSSLIFYFATFISLYLEQRRVYKHFRFVRHLIQTFLLLSANAISISRLTDYWHHWSDIVAGIILGVIVAVLTFYFVLLEYFQLVSNEMLKVKCETTTIFKKHSFEIENDASENQRSIPVSIV